MDKTNKKIKTYDLHYMKIRTSVHKKTTLRRVKTKKKKQRQQTQQTE